jgi:hypothetical protein
MSLRRERERENKKKRRKHVSLKKRRSMFGEENMEELD